MKHYTDTKYAEWLVYEDEVGPLNNRRFRRAVSEVKRGYRRRERAALKRQTREMVAEELHGSDAAYWERQLDHAAEDWYALEAAEVAMRDLGCWDERKTVEFAAAYREVSRRANAAYDEWMAA